MNFDATDDVFGGGGFDDGDGDLSRDARRTFAAARRVRAWQAGLAPMLEEQEHRPEFKIHGCGRRMIL